MVKKYLLLGSLVILAAVHAYMRLIGMQLASHLILIIGVACGVIILFKLRGSGYFERVGVFIFSLIPLGLLLNFYDGGGGL